ncbi:unnamed protein product [Anisakis simplex]|uniref:Ubiquitin-like domain-containing protein n=1 Tax=Anisakis simplex TaxID=6269 RepID=A0A0M3JXE5_ANISI|nr:unnamed protein product [Anisakis simplex]
MLLFVKNQRGRALSIDMDETDTVMQLLKEVLREEGFEVQDAAQSKLIYKDPSGGALPQHWLNPDAKNFRTRRSGSSLTGCSVAKGDNLMDKSVSSTESIEETNESTGRSETSTTTSSN